MIPAFPVGTRRAAAWIGLAGVILAGNVSACGEGCAGLESAFLRKFEGVATWYSTQSAQAEGTSGVWTASGEKYDERAFTCALPDRRLFGRHVRVCLDQPNSRCIVVRCNDLGPGVRARARGVVIDLTPAAFQVLSPLSAGRVAVTVSQLSDH